MTRRADHLAGRDTLPRMLSSRLSVAIRPAATRGRLVACLLTVTVVAFGIGAFAVTGARAGGDWTVVFDGYGSVRRAFVQDREAHELAPAAARRPDETHAALVVSTRSFDDLRLTMEVRTARQLRRGSPPNPWEAAWAVWHYQDEGHFYYLVLKPNGWELGKRHPEGEGGQRFLASGDTPAYPLGAWYRLDVTQVGPTITVRVDGRLLTRFTDDHEPYLGGRIGMYVEDAVAQFAAVRAVPAVPRPSGPDAAVGAAPA